MSRSLGKHSSYGVIIDVGSGSIGIGIVDSDEKSKLPEIIFTHRETIRIGENPTPDERVRAMRQMLFSATLVLSEKGLPKLKEHDSRASIGRILVVCAAPWSETITQIIHIENEEPFTITHEWIEDLIEKAQKQSMHKKKEETLLNEFGLRVVEKTVVDISLNGYSVDDPYEKEARELHIAHLTGLVPEDVLTAIDEIEEKLLTDVHTTAHTYALVLYCVLRDLYPHTKNSLIIDVSGEATEICVMRDGILYDTFTVGYGAYTLARDVARVTGTIPEEARTHIKSFTDESGEMYNKLMSASETYQQSLEDMLGTVTQKYVLPQNIFLTIDPDLQPFFMHIFKKVREKDAKTTMKTIVPIGPKTATELAHFHENTSPDAFLAVAARFFHKLHACGEMKLE